MISALRLSIEHMAEKFCVDFQLHVIASMQPYHAVDDGRWAEKRLATTGHGLATRGAVSSIMGDACLRDGLACAPLNPMLDFTAAVTRATLGRKNPDGWIPEKRSRCRGRSKPTPVGSAFAEISGEPKRSIYTGKLADMVT